jgi:trimeric autotransporter adhesin
MATTTNYSWTTPDDTDLVKDGAAAIRTLGSSADTTVKDLNPGTTAGDIDYYTSSTAKARVAIGTAGQVLKVNGGGTAPEWATTADQTPLTTKGDLFTFDTADARLGVGANGTVLTANSSEATGLEWAAPAAGGETLISTTTLSGASTVLSPVPTGYNAIRILITGATNDTADGKLRINGVSQNVSMSGVESTAAVGIINGFLESNSNYLRTSNSNGANLIIYNYTENAIQRQPIYYSGHYIATGSVNKAFIYGGSGGSGSGWGSITILNTGGNWSAGTVKLFGVK